MTRSRIPFCFAILLGSVGVLSACAPAARGTGGQAARPPVPGRAAPASPAGAVGGTPAAGTPTTGLPLRRAPRPTGAAVSADDMMTRMYLVADDSMQGRRAGTPGNLRATAYLAAEMQRLGLEPGGDGGTFFQRIPLVRTGVDPTSSLTLDGSALRLWDDFVPLPPDPQLPNLGTVLRGESLQTIFGGTIGGPRSPLTAEQARGKLVVLGAPSGPQTGADAEFWSALGLNRFPTAAGIVVAALGLLPPGLVDQIRAGGGVLDGAAQPAAGGPVALFVSPGAAARLLDADASTLRAGAAGRTVRANITVGRQPTAAPARNVVAIIRGSDPVLRNQYVAIGAHNDHIGVQDRAVDHDSLRAYNEVIRPEGAEDQPRPPSPAEATRIRVLLDSLRQAHGVVRLDSIANGADDDGSGTVGLLEIAEAMTAQPRPKRSILLVWHTAEELGLFGSEYFTDHPTVPRDSIVAQLNIDMIGRGRDEDITGPQGGPGYLQLVGSRRLSTELGALVEAVNTRGNHGFRFDYQYDAPNHPQQIYCRSDHYNYARYGIPVVFFTTGVHRDYHQVTDEPQYIDYAKLTSVTSFIRDVANEVANLDHRVRVDQPRPDPRLPCRQ